MELKEVPTKESVSTLFNKLHLNKCDSKPAEEPKIMIFNAQPIAHARQARDPPARRRQPVWRKGLGSHAAPFLRLKYSWPSLRKYTMDKGMTGMEASLYRRCLRVGGRTKAQRRLFSRGRLPGSTVTRIKALFEANENYGIMPPKNRSRSLNDLSDLPVHTSVLPGISFSTPPNPSEGVDESLTRNCDSDTGGFDSTDSSGEEVPTVRRRLDFSFGEDYNELDGIEPLDSQHGSLSSSSSYRSFSPSSVSNYASFSDGEESDAEQSII